MQPEVRKTIDFDEFETEERCSILEIANDEADETVSIARARVRPGVTTAWHELTDTHERYLVVAGEGRAEMDGLTAVIVAAGDVVRIPAGTAQRITNTGVSDLIFYAVCSPRFRPSSYVSLE